MKQCLIFDKEYRKEVGLYSTVQIITEVFYLFPHQHGTKGKNLFYFPADNFPRIQLQNIYYLHIVWSTKPPKNIGNLVELGCKFTGNLCSHGWSRCNCLKVCLVFVLRLTFYLLRKYDAYSILMSLKPSTFVGGEKIRYI